MSLSVYTSEMEEGYMILLMFMSALDYTEIVLAGALLEGFMLTPS